MHDKKKTKFPDNSLSPRQTFYPTSEEVSQSINTCKDSFEYIQVRKFLYTLYTQYTIIFFQ